MDRYDRYAIRLLHIVHTVGLDARHGHPLVVSYVAVSIAQSQSSTDDHAQRESLPRQLRLLGPIILVGQSTSVRQAIRARWI